MTDEQYQGIISRLDSILSAVQGIQLDVSTVKDLWNRSIGDVAATWFNTPSGTFGVLHQATFGDLLLSLIGLALVVMYGSRAVHRALSRRGVW